MESTNTKLAPDKIRENFENIRIKQIKTSVISEYINDKWDRIDPQTIRHRAFQTSIQFNVNGKIKKFTIKPGKNETKSPYYDEIELIIMHAAAGKRFNLNHIGCHGRLGAFRNAVVKIKKKISHALYMASIKKANLKRIQTIWVKKRREFIFKQIKEFLSKPEFKILRTQDIMSIWTDVQNTRIVKQVIDV